VPRLAVVITGTHPSVVVTWVRSDTQASAPEGCEFVHESQLESWVAADASPEETPQFVFPWQLQTWLLQKKGVAPADIEGLLGALPGQARTQALIDWTKAATYRRDHPLIDQLGASLGMTPQDIDQAFREASQLQ